MPKVLHQPITVIKQFIMEKTILLIEDNEELRENIAEILELADYRILTAENGKVGVEKAIAAQPDLIICDIMMPVLDGYGVVHLLNKNSQVQNTPFIFLSAKSERGDIRKGMELGADDYIPKPFTEIELLTAIESRLRKIELAKKSSESNVENLNTLYSEVSSKQSLQTLMTEAISQEFNKKATIYSERKTPFYLYYVAKGKVKTYLVNDFGKELIVDMFTEGDFFGYTSLLEGGPYKESAAAMEDTDLLLILKKDFDLLLNSNREIAATFIRMLARNVVGKEHLLLGLAYNSLRRRVAEALLQYKKKFGNTDINYIINISRHEMANIAGTATESLIRTLTDFRDEKIIDIVDGNIIILNESKLVNLIGS
jgi:CRP/FNR family cyclic AMP-dependent transcriptional regulator